MIPIKDTVPRRTFPFITFGLIAVNGKVFLFQISHSKDEAADVRPPSDAAPRRRGTLSKG